MHLKKPQPNGKKNQTPKPKPTETGKGERLGGLFLFCVFFVFVFFSCNFCFQEGKTEEQRA